MFVTRTSRFTTMGLAPLFAICMVSSGRADQPSFTTIDVPGASSTVASGISPDGDIVGFYNNATGTHGFLLRVHAESPLAQVLGLIALFHTYHTYQWNTGRKSKSKLKLYS